MIFFSEDADYDAKLLYVTLYQDCDGKRYNLNDYLNGRISKPPPSPHVAPGAVTRLDYPDSDYELNDEMEELARLEKAKARVAEMAETEEVFAAAAACAAGPSTSRPSPRVRRHTGKSVQFCPPQPYPYSTIAFQVPIVNKVAPCAVSNFDRISRSLVSPGLYSVPFAVLSLSANEHLIWKSFMHILKV